MPEHSMTGIPVEFLWGSIAALLAIVYGGMRAEISKLRKESHRRTSLLNAVALNTQNICTQLGMHFIWPDREDEP